MGWGDRALGILLGLVLGILIVVAFVFVGSDTTIDAPSLKGGGAQQATAPEGGTRTAP